MVFFFIYSLIYIKMLHGWVAFSDHATKSKELNNQRIIIFFLIISGSSETIRKEHIIYLKIYVLICKDIVQVFAKRRSIKLVITFCLFQLSQCCFFIFLLCLQGENSLFQLPLCIFFFVNFSTNNLLRFIIRCFSLKNSLSSLANFKFLHNHSNLLFNKKKFFQTTDQILQCQ